jgi:hypothetical protein
MPGSPGQYVDRVVPSVRRGIHITAYRPERGEPSAVCGAAGPPGPRGACRAPFVRLPARPRDNRPAPPCGRRENPDQDGSSGPGRGGPACAGGVCRWRMAYRPDLYRSVSRRARETASEQHWLRDIFTSKIETACAVCYDRFWSTRAAQGHGVRSASTAPALCAGAVRRPGAGGRAGHPGGGVVRPRVQDGPGFAPGLLGRGPLCRLVARAGTAVFASGRAVVSRHERESRSAVRAGRRQSGEIR